MPHPVAESASVVCQRIYEIDVGEVDLRNGAPVWLKEVSTLIALLTGESAILYLDHNIGLGQTGRDAANVVAVTDDILIQVLYGNGVGEPPTETKIIPRSSLRRMSIDNLSNALGFELEQWPSRMQVTLIYPDVELNLPYRRYNQQACADLAALVPSLARQVDPVE